MAGPSLAPLDQSQFLFSGLAVLCLDVLSGACSVLSPYVFENHGRGGMHIEREDGNRL